ncbi:MAG: hypothetical protein KC431_27440, partial [Myxococcales bacterium]|nr:hypothetical protein [Myxococcales bacterium]
MGVVERRSSPAPVLLVLLALLCVLTSRPTIAGAPPTEAPDLEDTNDDDDDDEDEDDEDANAAEQPSAAAIAEVLVGERSTAFVSKAGQQSSRQRLIWRPTSVAWPLAPLTRVSEQGDFVAVDELPVRLRQRQAMLTGEMAVPSVRGPVAIDAQQAVDVWIGALETVRVRRLSGTGELRFVRVVDDATVVFEPGRAVDPGPGGEPRYELTQPPADGAVWSIEADGPAEVLVERAESRSPRYAAVEVEDSLMRWIEADAPLDHLPAVLEPAEDFVADLRLNSELGRELRRLGDDELQLRKAVVAWQQLAAIQGLDRLR